MKEKFKISPLEIIIFTSGTVVMILELIGSRILAPYLGTSIFVWTSLIGIILGALSLGYYLGGRFSANNPQIKFLTRILFLAGIAILLITLIKEPILILSMELGVKLGAVVATLALFTLPSIILGMVSPYAIRLKIKNVENAGGVAGNLYALSTIGSIFGTFLAGFYLIPAFGSTQILFGLSFVLILASLLGGKKKLKLSCLVLVVGAWLIYQIIPSPYIFETDSAYNHIRVADVIQTTGNARVRILYLATETHSLIYRDSDDLFSIYSQLYQLDNLFKPNIKKALALGGGAYVIPINFLKRYPQGEVTVVEIDPKVTEVAREYFQLTDDSRMKIFHQDGRIFLNNNTEKFDVIYGDAFASFYSIPFHLTTREAVEKIHDSLADDGALILNVISSLKGEGSKFFQAEYKTLAEIFPQIYIFPAYFYGQENLEKHQNIILIASKNKSRLTKEDLFENADATQQELLDHFWDQEVVIDPKIPVLTDEFAPVDYYISKLLQS